jgi:FHA domain
LLRITAVGQGASLWASAADKEIGESYKFRGRDHLTFGKDTSGVNSVILNHPSISKQHAAIQFRRTAKGVHPWLVDLESVNKTYLYDHVRNPPRASRAAAGALVKALLPQASVSMIRAACSSPADLVLCASSLNGSRLHGRRLRCLTLTETRPNTCCYFSPCAAPCLTSLCKLQEQDGWKPIESARYVQLLHNDRFKFAQSTRDYVIQDILQCELDLRP